MTDDGLVRGGLVNCFEAVFCIRVLPRALLVLRERKSDQVGVPPIHREKGFV